MLETTSWLVAIGRYTVISVSSRLVRRATARQPAGKIWSSWLGRRILPGYYMRILIYVTPRRALFWPDRDFSKAPEELDPEVLRGVG